MKRVNSVSATMGKFAGPLAQGVLDLQLGSGVKFNP